MIQGESIGCVLLRCLLTCTLAACLPGGQALSLGCVCNCRLCWAPGPPSPSWSPVVPGSEQAPGGQSGPISMARFSLWCPVSLLCHTLPAYAGGASSPRNARPIQITLVLLRCLRPHPCLCSPPPPVSLILSAAPW